MRKSDSRILTTHAGSLPRPPSLRELLVRQDHGEPVDERELAREVETAVQVVVAKQLGVGVDIGNDGEQPRAGFSTYVARRMRGFGGESKRLPARDFLDFPDYAAMLALRRRAAARIANAPQAVAEVRYDDVSAVARDCDVFARSTDAAAHAFVERFMTSASPGTIATVLLNAYYDSHERYVMALAREMRKEYELIHSRGLVLQLDCPDLAMERTRFFQHESLEAFQRAVALHVEAINQATVGIPADRIRLHVCWGNYDGPHVYDVALEAVLPLILRARVGGISLPFANPRHQHEYKVIARQRWPETMLLLPGIIDTTTNYVEHPENVADRICQAAEAIGDPRRVIASTDCGFGTFAGTEMCAESVVWAKLRALTDGAAIASERLRV